MPVDQAKIGASPVPRHTDGDGREGGSRSAATATRLRRRLSYRRLVVCLSPAEASARACGVACTLAAERGAVLTAIAAIEVPLEMPLRSTDVAAETAAREAVYTAHAIGDSYGVTVAGVVLRAHTAGEAIVAEVTARRAQLVIVPVGWTHAKRDAHLPLTASYVLKHAPCRVMLIGRNKEAPDADHSDESDTVFHAARPSDYWPTGRFLDRDDRDATRRSDGNRLPAL